MTKAKRWLRDAALLIGAVAGISLWQTRAHVGGGEPAPPIVGKTLAGAPFTLEKGTPVVAYFLAPWCGVCKLSASNAERAGRWLGEERVRVVYVALAYESVESVAAFVKEAGLTAPVVLADDAVGEAFKVGAYPTYYALDSELRIKTSSVGYSPTLGVFTRALLSL